MDPGLALHKALLAALKSDMSVDVWDAVPQGAAYPYVTVDTSISANEDHLVERVDARFVYLNVWSQQRGQEEVLRIMGEIDAALHGRRMSLDEGTLVNVRVDRKHTRRDSDNVTFQGQVTLRIITQH